jgi:hypothetical protein
MKAINYKTIAILSLLVFAFLLGFSFSVQAYRISRQELNSPVSQYLRENYGVNSIEEYQAKLEQEIWLNYSRQMEALATEYPEINFSQWRNPDVYRQYGTSTYQPPKITPQQPFYIAIFSEPVTALQIFSLSGLGLIGLAAVPPIRRSKRLKQALFLGVVALSVFSIGYFVGLTTAQTGTITIEPGSFAETASYVIWTDGTYVYAKNGKTGQIDFSGSYAGTVIQSVINASTSGGKIFIKAGTYSCSPIQILNSGIILQGEGNRTVLKALSTNTADLITVRANNVAIRDMRLEGLSGLKHKLIAGLKSDLVLEYLDLYNPGMDAITLWGYPDYVENVKIKNCRFNAPNNYGVFIAHGRNIEIANNLFVSVNYSAVGVSMQSADIYILNNEIVYATDTGIDVEGVSSNFPNYSCDGVVIDGNIIRQTGGAGIFVIDARKAVVTNNIVLQSGSPGGICFATSTSTPAGSNIDGGFIMGNFVTNSHIGIFVWGEDQRSVREITVSNNIAIANKRSGISFGGYTSGLTVTNNITLNNSQEAAGTYDGIRISGPYYSVFANNISTDIQATKTQKIGINEAYGNYNIIMNNYVAGNLGAGIAKYGANTVVKGNIGYDTENFKVTGLSVTVGTGGAYGSATSITTPSGRVSYPRVKITWGGTFGTDETVTVKVQAVYTDGTTAYVEKSATATGSLWLTDDDVLSLITQGKDIVNLNVYAKTNLASTTVTVTVDAYGKA